MEAAPELELALPVSLNVACLRYICPDLDDATLDDLNKQVEVELQEQGIAIPSIVSIKGRNYLHVAIANHRSRRDDLDLLVREVIRTGNELAHSPHTLGYPVKYNARSEGLFLPYN